MPELPEVETVRRGVAAAFVGSRILAVEATGARSTRRHPDRVEFVDRQAGRTVSAVDRHGKYLLLRLDSGDVVVVHLGMSGQLLRVEAGAPARAHTHIRWELGGDLHLRFVDPRTFGEVFVTRPDPDGVLPELASLGPDALEGLPTWRNLAAIVAGRRTRLKPLLMDQHRVAGIGNIYADEILFAAKLAGDRQAGSLATAELRRLHRSIAAILAAAVAHRGSTLSDAQYRDVEGTAGDYQLLHAVYARGGHACVRCGRPVQRRREGGRSSFSCPHCQR